MDFDEGDEERGRAPPSMRPRTAEAAPQATGRPSPISRASVVLRRSKSSANRRPKRKLQSDLALYDDPEVIESFLRDEVGMDAELTKTAFRQLLLDEAGVHVEDALLEAIFAATDQDGNGLLDATELATFIHEIRPSSKRQRRKYVALSCLLYPPFYLSFFCLNASLMSATTNLRERPYGDLAAKSRHPYWKIAATSDLIGLCGYVILKWEEERLKYENLQAARVRLVQWVNVDLPLFIMQTARRESNALRKAFCMTKENGYEIDEIGFGMDDFGAFGDDLPSPMGLSCSDVIREIAPESYEQEGIHMHKIFDELETWEGEWHEDPPLAFPSDELQETVQSVGRAYVPTPKTRDIPTEESDDSPNDIEKERTTNAEQNPQRERQVSFADNSTDEHWDSKPKSGRQVSFADNSIDEEQDQEDGIPTEEEVAPQPSHLLQGFVAEGMKKTGVALKETGAHVADGATATRNVLTATGDALKETGAQVADGALATGDVFMEGLMAVAEEVLEGVDAIKRVRQGIEQNPDDAIKFIRPFIHTGKKDESVEMCSDDDTGLDIQEMRMLLETMGVFLAAHALKEIVLEIDTDGSGTVTVLKLLDFAQKAEKQLSRKSRRTRYAGIFQRCCLTIGWWTSWSFVTGACFWVTLSFVKGASVLELKMYLGLTCLLYLFGALGNITSLYRATEALTWQINSADSILRAAAVSIGLAQIEGGEEEDNGPRNRIRADALDRLEGTLDCSDYSTSSKTERSRQELRNMRSSISGEGDQQQVYDQEAIAKAQEEGTRILFETIDVSEDGQIDEKELFDALNSLGVMIPSQAFSRLFRAVDVSGDGQIKPNELVNYVSKIKPGFTDWQRRRQTVRYMIQSTSFYLVLAQVFAGSAQVHAAWVGLSTVNATRNLFLAGSFAWAVGSFYFIATWPKNKGNFFDQLENAKFGIKASILEGCGRFQRSSFKRKQMKQ